MRRLKTDFVLHGERVNLSCFAEQDITETYLGWLNDPSVVEFSNQRFRTHERVSASLYLSSFVNTDNLFLAIRRADSDQLIGTMTAYISEHHGTADIGIMIGDCAVWGQGFGYDAWTTLMNWLLVKEAIRKVTAGTLGCNTGMLSIIKRSGMMLEGARRRQELVHGKEEDIFYFAKFNGD